MFKRLLNLEGIEQSIFLFGPRGTGKTSWLKAHFPQALYFDLLSTKTYTDFLSYPETLETRVPEHIEWVIIDEIQRIPVLLNEVHRLIEARKIKFLLTGSSARKLRQQGVNLLAGRALTYHMHPLVAEEIGEIFNYERALTSGLLPMAYQSNHFKKYLHSYVETYLKEEVQQEALTRNLALFARFLAVAAFSQGQVLNYTNIAREIGTSRQTVTNFFDILEDLLIATRLSVFDKRAQRELMVQNKFYYFDVGIYLTMRPRGILDKIHELNGPGLETLLLQHLRALNDYYFLEYTIYFWRTVTQLEVDFVLYGERGLLAFEVKHSNRLTRQDFKGLLAFKKDYPMAFCWVIYLGEATYYQYGIKIVPLKNILPKISDLLMDPEKSFKDIKDC